MSNEDLLRILESHGQQFLQAFDTSIGMGKRKVGPTSSENESNRRKICKEEDSENEWTGIAKDSSSDQEEDSDGGEEKYDDEDDEFVYESRSRQPHVVVFSEASTSASILKNSKAGFMSSKVHKLAEEERRPATNQSSEDEDEDLSNAQNDALLHRLVHTKLLSGSLDHGLNLAPAQRKKALAGRVMEAAGKVKLGKGEATVRQKEHNRAAKHVRDGLAEKKKERQQKQLEEAKQLGNYHPALKALYDGSSTLDVRKKKRDRGLKMGVGSFKGGILKLRKSEISAVEGRSRGRSRGNGTRPRGGKR